MILFIKTAVKTSNPTFRYRRNPYESYILQFIIANMAKLFGDRYRELENKTYSDCENFRR
jgi:hypothetical protein